jgi:hypothetical protein
MGFKRKRSVDDSPLSISSYGAVSTPTAQSPTHLQSFDGAMDMDVDTLPRHNGWDFASASRTKGGDWGNRTRKRFRDNRPDAQAIHESTLDKLFAAQRTHPNASPLASGIEPIPAVSKPQKSTLHSFWKQLPAPPVQPTSYTSPPLQTDPPSQLPRCDDCDTPLQSVSDSMDVDVDVDMGGAVESNPFACDDCGKTVCGTCAVVSTKRHCLQCATSGRNSRRWW